MKSWQSFHYASSLLANLPLTVEEYVGICFLHIGKKHTYKHFFDGSSLLTPVLHPHVDMSVLPQVGVVLSHGYLACGFLPTRNTFPASACILLGPTIEVQSEIQVEAFADILSSFEASVIKEENRKFGLPIPLLIPQA